MQKLYKKFIKYTQSILLMIGLMLTLAGTCSLEAQQLYITGPTTLTTCQTAQFSYEQYYSSEQCSLISGIQWTVSGVSTIQPNAQSSVINVSWSVPGTYTLTLVGNLECCNYDFEGTFMGCNQYIESTNPLTVVVTSPNIIAPILQGTSGMGFAKFEVTNPQANLTYRWYDSPTQVYDALVPTGTSIIYNNPGINPNVCQNKTYYVATVANGCESNTRTAVSATYYPPYALIRTVNPTGSLDDVNGTTSTTLALSPDPGASCSIFSRTWKRNGITVGNGATYLARQSGVYTLEISVNGNQFVVGPLRVKSIYENSSPTLNKSFVLTNEIRKKNVKSSSDIGALTSVADRDRSITYMDDLGRPIQSVAMQSNPFQKDIVQPIAYDALGREAKKYQPYTGGIDGKYQSNALSAQASFYQLNTNVTQTTSAPYAETSFENSPLSRPKAQGSVGTVWQLGGKTIKSNYRAYNPNPNTDAVRIWNLSSAGVLTIHNTSVYQAGELSVSEVLDEEDRKSLEFTNKSGQTVLKRVIASITLQGQTSAQITNLDTYYIYDDLGQLRMILPPVALQIIQSVPTPWVYDPLNSSSSMYAVVQAHAYRMNYDALGRQIQQYLPGVSEPIVTVYDHLDRPILTQDGKQKKDKKWSFVKYDILERPILSGEVTYPNNLSRAELQTIVDGYYAQVNNTCNSAVKPFEERKVAGTNVQQGYTIHQAYPSPCVSSTDAPTLDIQKISYYDDYDFDNNGSPDISIKPFNSELFQNGETVTSNAFYRLKNVLTGTKVKILRKDALTDPDMVVGIGGEYLQTVNFYDKYGRVIQTRADNHLANPNSSDPEKRSEDIITTQYAFDGTVLRTLLRHKTVTSDNYIFISKKNEYDDNGRVKKSYQKIQELSQTNPNNAQFNATEQILAEYAYNESEQVTAKKVGSSNNGSTYLQTIDYKYNEKGWLTAVNNTSNLDSDLFAMEFFYNTSATNTNPLHSVSYGLSALQTPQFNGNISAMQWKSSSDNVLRGFAYDYTNLNQIEKAIYKRGDNPTITNKIDQFSLEEIKYDLNGNITNLKQRGLNDYTHKNVTLGTDGSPIYDVVDELTYNYIDPVTQIKGNQLISVADNANSSGKGGDFKKVTTNAYTRQYIYNENGNLSSDENKGINIKYNSQDLPIEINVVAGDYTGYQFLMVYDAVGNKLRSTTKKNGQLIAMYDYIGGAVYAQTTGAKTLQFINHEEGRVLHPSMAGGTDFVYEYFYRDHLGNLRVIFKAPPTTITFKSQMDDLATDRNQGFRIVDATQNGERFVSGTKSAKLTDANPVGPWISLAVSKGDIINANVKGLYKARETEASNNVSLMVYLQSIPGVSAANQNAPDKPLDGEQANDYGLYLGIGLPLGPANPVNETQVNASLKLVYYTKDGHYLDTKPINLHGNDANTWITLSQALTATQDGYVQIFVVSESNKKFDVWFDDLIVTLTPSQVSQENHYSPFGLNLAGIEKNGRNEHQWQFQGKEKYAALMYYDFGSRYYDPQLGRWHATDPQNQFASPYLGLGNNPLNGTDPDGEWFGWDDLAAAAIGFTVGYVSSGLSTGDWGGKSLKAGAIGAVTGWLAYNTAGLSASTSPIVGSTSMLPGQGVSSWTAANLGKFAINQSLGAITSALPMPQMQIGNVSFGLSPSLAMGTGGLGFGMNFSASAQFGDWTIGGSIGSMEFAGGKYESRFSIGGGYDDGEYGASYYLTKFGGYQAQRSGEFNLRHKEWGLRINNDLFPFADGGDRFRTGGGQLSYLDYSVGFAIKTGDPTTGFKGKKSIRPKEASRGVFGYSYTSDSANDPRLRLGALYIGYRGQRIGWSSDGIRHAVQNIGIHDVLLPSLLTVTNFKSFKSNASPWFKRLGDVPSIPYYYNGNVNRYTLW